MIYLCSSKQVLYIVKNLGGYFCTHSVIISYIINSIVISNKMLAHIGLRVLLMLTGYIVFLGSFSDHSMLIEVDSSSFLCSDIFIGSVVNAYS